MYFLWVCAAFDWRCFAFRGNKFRSRPNVELFMRRTKLYSKLKFMKSSRSGSVKFAWISLDRPTRSIRLLQIWRSSPGQTSIFTCNELNELIKNLYDNVYLASFGRKFITCLIQLISSTRAKFDVWPNRRSSFNLGRNKLVWSVSWKVRRLT